MIQARTAGRNSSEGSPFFGLDNGVHYRGNLIPTSGPLRAVADFNGDGLLDIAGPFAPGAGDGFPGTALLLGRGDGSFQKAPDGPVTDWRTGIGSARQVDYADFNNDGKLDLVGVTGYVQVYLGNGDGTFGDVLYALPQAFGNGFTALAVGDFNKDGNMDIVAGSGGVLGAPPLQPGNFVYVLLGRGDGTFAFTPGPTADFFLAHTRLIAADMDGDGNLDLVATDGLNSQLLVLRGLGDGTFARNPTTIQPLPLITSLPAGVLLGTVADLNGDGRLDVALTGAVQFGFTTAVTPGNSLSVLLGRGDGTFDPPAVYDTPGAFDVLAADYTGDGFPDLVVTRPPPDGFLSDNTDLGALYLLVNRGDGSFAPAVRIAGPSAPLLLASGDFNRDGRPDVLLTDWFQGVSVLPGDGHGAFFTAQRHGVVPIDDHLHPLDVPLVADLNGDRIPDLILSERGSGQIHVLLGNGDGTFRPTYSFGSDTFPTPISAMATADINSDGKLDLVFNSSILFVDAFSNRQARPALQILLGNGDGTFEPLPASPVPGDVLLQDTRVADLALADFDEDGVLDLVVALQQPFGPTPLIAVIRGPLLQSDGTLSPVVLVPVPGLTASPVRLQVGDFNDDGHLDVALLEPGHDSRIAILGGIGNGFFSPTIGVFSAPPNSASLAAADVNGDGVLDLVVAAYETGPDDHGSLDVYQGRGDGTFQPAATRTTRIISVSSSRTSTPTAIRTSWPASPPTMGCLAVSDRRVWLWSSTRATARSAI